MPGTYRKRIYMSLVHTDSFRQTPICACSTQRINKQEHAIENYSGFFATKVQWSQKKKMWVLLYISDLYVSEK